MPGRGGGDKTVSPTGVFCDKREAVKEASDPKAYRTPELFPA